MDRLVDWLIEKNKAGYQMVNSVARLHEMKAFMRMASGQRPDPNWLERRWNRAMAIANGSPACPVLSRRRTESCILPSGIAGADRTTSSSAPMARVGPCFPMYAATYDWGKIDGHKFEQTQLQEMKKTCQQHCFSTLNHNLGYCYNDARVIKFVWTNLVKNRMQGGARSFED